MKRIQDYPNFMEACKSVSNDLKELAHAIRKEDAYADHVSESKKDLCLSQSLSDAEIVANGEIQNLTVWQRVNTYLTGECVAILP